MIRMSPGDKQFIRYSGYGKWKDGDGMKKPLVTFAERLFALKKRNDVPTKFVNEPTDTKAQFRDYPNVHVACGLMPSEFSKND